MNRNGEVSENRRGEKFIIEEYKNANDVTVVFEDDTRVNTTYQKFKNGNVCKNPDNDNIAEWVGEIVEDQDGNECVIIEYIADDKVVVQYSDGEILSNIPVEDIRTSSFSRTDVMKNQWSVYGGDGIEYERRLTYENVIYMLNRFRRCVMARPCSFGKTRIGLKVFASPIYQRCLFLHPSDDDINAQYIKNSQSSKVIDIRTYAWLRKRTKKQIEALDYDIVFCDEVHCIGGDDDGRGAYMTYTAMKTFMETHPQTHFLGATATPFRMDGIPVVTRMFHNHVCYPYTDEDAFEDGLLKRPHYYYCIYDVKKKVRDEIEKTVNINMSKDELQKTLKMNEDMLNEIDSKYMDKHIKKTCDNILPDTTYMRFIAFYLTNEEIRKNKAKVIGWFQQAYPDHEIASIVVTNRTNKSLKDVDNLPTTPTSSKYKGRIDIIFNCEKLCMGYHSEFITGLLLDRKTQSLTKYTQMIGRLLSCDNNKPVIIFDVVDNLHSDFICKASPLTDEPKVTSFIPVKHASFNELLKAYPHAIHWNEIKATNKKARKAENMIRQVQQVSEKAVSPALEKHINDFVPNIHTSASVKTETTLQMPDKNISSCTSTVNLSAPVKATKPMSPDFYIRKAGIKDEFSKEIYTYSETDINVCTEPMHKSESICVKTDHDTAAKTALVAAVQEVTPEVIEEDSEPLGFTETYFYDMNTKDLYSRNVILVNQSADFEAEMKATIQKVTQKALDTILKKWHTYPTCEENYTNYAQIDKKSSKFKFLKSCSEFIYGIPVEQTLLYMIEGKIA